MQLTCLDDDPRMEPTLRRFAGRLGHDVRYHANASAFKQDILSHPPELVVLDLELGRETGLDIVKWLSQQRLQLPIVLLSGHGDELLDTARRIASANGLTVRGAVSKASMVRDLPPLLAAQQPSTPPPPPPSGMLAEAPAQPAALDGPTLAGHIAAGRIEPFFQPIVAGDGTLKDLEVLTRLRLPDGTIVGAEQVIPLAEASGLIPSLTESLFERLLAAKATLADLSLDHLSVNLSVAQLDIVLAKALVRRLVDGLAGCCDVRVELTESANLADSQAVRELGAELRLLGASLAMDDFGTGYSSIRALAELPYDTLKLDLCFVAEMFDSSKAERLLAAILILSQNLGLKVVAEGVETLAQAQWLREAGVDRFQGYLFGPPTPLDEVMSRFGPKT
ncbi:EAL domain-containing response regulator [uncultured Thiohalocapsa sp.]|uniref:EAL domain-containing response regulator n=1 Tax=uncultured Thiohalocapsa sp. TaxID=768990 RepID=UPI0025FEB2B3|nr:EAL domain-containing response regulator [uncultured Thiohalocapsa sp.]